MTFFSQLNDCNAGQRDNSVSINISGPAGWKQENVSGGGNNKSMSIKTGRLGGQGIDPFSWKH